jgi:pyruvate dehydrogenase E1 component alpha subunit
MVMQTLINHPSLQRLETMLLIRAYEEAALALLAEGKAGGTCTSVGQEASAVGVISALCSDDSILTNHRSAGHLLARGADPGRMLAEVMGREDGYCGGKSGSLHISDKALGVLLTSTIVGGELSLATGVALSRSMAGAEGIIVCFFGDGAAAQGRFHESVNLAATWGLPILYVCENNHWQFFVHRDETTLVPRVADRAAAYGIPGVTVDGNDVEAVHSATLSALETIRATGRPFLLETLTYRMRGHFEPDTQGYVDPAELAHWKTRDPIDSHITRLKALGLLTYEALSAMRLRVTERISTARNFALASPFPALTDLTTNIYA